jgi:hypothetical protein
MDDDEEQPIAIAFCDGQHPGASSLDEFVFEDDIFWGTIYRIFNNCPYTTQVLTWRNNDRIEALLQRYLGFLAAPLRLMIARFLHFHY